jgi:hypothetical protein
MQRGFRVDNHRKRIFGGSARERTLQPQLFRADQAMQM